MKDLMHDVVKQTLLRRTSRVFFQTKRSPSNRRTLRKKTTTRDVTLGQVVNGPGSRVWLASEAARACRMVSRKCLGGAFGWNTEDVAPEL